MLALHQEIQEKVFEEIRGIFPHNDSVVTAEDLKQLDLTDRVIKESMRSVHKQRSLVWAFVLTYFLQNNANSSVHYSYGQSKFQCR